MVAGYPSQSYHQGTRYTDCGGIPTRRNERNSVLSGRSGRPSNMDSKSSVRLTSRCAPLSRHRQEFQVQVLLPWFLPLNLIPHICPFSGIRCRSGRRRSSHQQRRSLKGRQCCYGATFYLCTSCNQGLPADPHPVTSLPAPTLKNTRIITKSANQGR